MAYSESNSKKLTSPGGGTFTLSISAAEGTTSVANNTSSMTIKASLSVGTGTFAASSENKLKIYWYDNNLNPSGKLLNTLTIKELTSGSKSVNSTVNVTHKDDGTLTGYAKAVWTKSGSLQWTPPSDSVSTSNKALTTIPRKSGLAVEKYGKYIADNIILITLDRKATNFTDTISWSCNGLSETIQTKSTLKKIALCLDDYAYEQTNVPAGYTKIRSKYTNYDLMNKILTTTNQTMSFTNTTYNGNTSLGSNTINFKYEIYMSPYINNPSLEVTDFLTKDLTGKTNTIIKGITNVLLTNNPTKDTNYKDNVEIANYLFSDSNSVIKETKNSYTFEKTQSNIFTVDLIDKRKLQPTTAVSIQIANFIEYFSPKITKLETSRSESTSSSVKIDVEGEFWNNSFGSKTNALNLKYRYKKNNETYSSYTTVTATKNSNKFTYSTTLSVSSDQSLTVEFIVSDSTDSSYSLTTTEPKGQSIFDIGDDYFNINGILAVNGTNIIDKIKEIVNTEVTDLKGKLFYTPGQMNIPYTVVSGFLSSGSKEIVLDIPLEKSLANISSITLDYLNIVVRGTTGYIISATTYNNPTSQGWRIGKRSNNRIYIAYTSSTNLGTNNTPVNAVIYGDTKITLK